MRRLVLTGLLLLLGAAGLSLLGGSAFSASAGAAKCLTCEGEGEGEVEAQFLAIEIVGKGSVSNGATGYCQNTTSGSKVCEVELAEGKEVTLSASPSGEYLFQGWSGDCSGSGNCEVTMSEAKSVKATFINPPPAAPTISSPSEGQIFAWTTEESISVSFGGNSGDSISFLCGIDSPFPAVGCTSPWSTGKLAAGEHTVRVWAKDGEGNVGSAASRNFKVTITPPSEEEGGSGEEEKEPPKEEGGSGSGGGGTPSGGTPGSGGTAGTAPPPGVAPVIAARAVVKSHLLGKLTVLRKLALKGLPAGANVAATCKGKGCPFKRKQVRVVKGVADLSPLFAKHQLAAGALIELKATAPGMTGQTIDVKTRAGKAPKVTTS